MKKFFLSALVLGFVASCNSDDSRDENQDNNPILPTKLTYTEDDKPSSSILKYNGAKLTEILDEEGGKQVVTYEGDNITKMVYYDKNGKAGDVDEYTYVNGKVAKSVSTEPSSNNNTSYITTVTYTWVDANHLKTSSVSNNNTTPYVADYYYSNGNLVKLVRENTVVTYTYDNTNNPFKNIKGMQVLLESDYGLNNLVKKESVYTWSGGVNTYSSTFTYEFNKNNYPTKQIAKSNNNGSDSPYEETSLYEYNR